MHLLTNSFFCLLASHVTELSTDESESSDSDDHEYTEPPTEEHEEDDDEEDSDSHEYIIPTVQNNEDDDNEDHDDGKFEFCVQFDLRVKSGLLFCGCNVLFGG